ncbi:hypothetical protein [uncultured Pseudacidovorax sp.]|uniref:hypothetical protein n=1 Tax=uncultured Pseudacidovorax sp. TaxID=679313 RepID=UPI0025F8A586|nr:hypothetical protein [uncultured Pseudacidovorax sp.]
MSELNVRLVGFSRIDYDKREIRRALRLEINKVRDDARSLLSSSSPSAPGEFPGRLTGVLQRAIKSKVLRGGLAAIARPEKTKRMGKDYYPAFLVHGVKQRKGRVLNPGLKPRLDPMPAALARRSDAATTALRDALQRSLIPRT